MTEPKNLPCPFCGGTNTDIRIGVEAREEIPIQMYCTNCGADSGITYAPAHKPEGWFTYAAKRVWNRRAVKEKIIPIERIADVRVSDGDVIIEMGEANSGSQPDFEYRIPIEVWKRLVKITKRVEREEEYRWFWSKFINKKGSN
jgi:hypothetical protein